MSPDSDAPVLSITQQDALLSSDAADEDCEDPEDGDEEDELPPSANQSASDVQKTFFRWV